MKNGLTVLSPMHDGTRTPTAFARIDCACGEVHHLWAADGRIHKRQVLDTGDRHLQPCPVAKIYPRRKTDGSRRWYIEFATPSCGTVHRDRIDTTEADRSRGYNRAEHLRQHVKTDAGDSVYDRCYGWRKDAESLNNTLDRTLYGGRMIAYRAVRQLTVMLGVRAGPQRNSSLLSPATTLPRQSRLTAGHHDERPPRTPRRRVASVVPATLACAAPRRPAKPSETAPGRPEHRRRLSVAPSG
jgi:hypothetical protein